MSSAKNVNTYLIYSVANEISANSNQISNIQMQLNHYLQSVDSEWDTKKKQAFMQAFHETQAQIKSCANLLEELANQVRMIPNKVVVVDK